MRYRKENGQWKEVTPLGVSREEFDEVKQDLTHNYYTKTEVDEQIPQYEYYTMETSYGAVRFRKYGKVVSVYSPLSQMASSASISLPTVPQNFRPNYSYAILNLTGSQAPYEPKGTVWISAEGIMTLYKSASQTTGYIYGSYVIH